jgi:hypothetical protein
MDLRSFRVPEEKKELYTKLHKQYCLPGPTNALTVHIGPGSNESNLVLP